MMMQSWMRRNASVTSRTCVFTGLCTHPFVSHVFYACFLSALQRWRVVACQFECSGCHCIVTCAHSQPTAACFCLSRGACRGRSPMELRANRVRLAHTAWLTRLPAPPAPMGFSATQVGCRQCSALATAPRGTRVPLDPPTQQRLCAPPAHTVCPVRGYAPCVGMERTALLGRRCVCIAALLIHRVRLDQRSCCVRRRRGRCSLIQGVWRARTRVCCTSQL